MITKKYYKLIRVSHADEGYFYIKNVSNEVGEFRIPNTNVSGNTEYSLDGVNWTSYDFTNRPTVNVNPGSNIYLRGTTWNIYYDIIADSLKIITFTQDYIAGGNLLSVLNYNTMSTETNISNSLFAGLFRNQTHLISASDMNFGNVTTVGNYSFASSFSGCTNLTGIPDFSGFATAGSSSFYYTFKGCSNLTTGADFSGLTSIGSYCCGYCYENCSKISNVTTPNIQNLTSNNVLSDWLNVAGGSVPSGTTKTVNVPTGATISSNNSGIPSGWTRVDY